MTSHQIFTKAEIRRVLRQDRKERRKDIARLLKSILEEVDDQIKTGNEDGFVPEYDLDQQLADLEESLSTALIALLLEP